MRHVIVVLGGLWLGLSPLPVVWTQQPDVGRLAWLGGCWRLEAGTRITDEQWMAPAGGAMLGMSRTVRDGKLVEYEHLTITNVDGRLGYTANPSGQAENTFWLVQANDTTAVFADPEHDFPQQLTYQRTRPDSLVVTIAGPSRGERREIAFRYRRVACSN